MSETTTERTRECRCWGCGSEEIGGCGMLCYDCSWEEYLASLAHTGEFDEPREGTPECCLRSREARLERLDDAR